MDSILLFVFSLLLFQVNERLPNERLPVAPPLVPAVTAPITPAAPPRDPSKLYIRSCMLLLPKRNHVTLAAPERAVLTLLQTENPNNADGLMPLVEGMNVVKGQVLGHFDDRELRSTLKINEAQLEVAKAERDKKIEETYAAHGVLVALAEYKMMKEANKLHAKVFSEIEIQRADLAHKQAEANLELQKYTIDEVKTREVTVRESELERTNVLIEVRQLIAPIDGMISKLHAAEGVWLREGDPVLDIMKLDTLWAEGKVSIREYEMNDLDGKPAAIFLTLANGTTETFQGKVVFCDPSIQAGNTYNVYVEVQNRRSGNFWLLQPGRNDVEIVIQDLR